MTMISYLSQAATQKHPPRRCAIYARYSSLMQDKTSIEDQFRQCRQAIHAMGWVVVEEFVLSDEAKTGATTIGREAFEQLRRHAQSKDRPFDTLVMAYTSRFARNLSDSLPITDQLNYDGVGLYFVKEKLASWEPHFRDLFITSMRQAENFLVTHGQLVQQGHEGQVERGFVGSGRTYGYLNVPKEIPGTRTSYGRPKVEGVNMVPNPDEVKIIVRLFEAVAAGVSQIQLVHELNREQVPISLAYTGKMPRMWNMGMVGRILNNEKYIGQYIYRKRATIRNPRTGKGEQVMRPREEWMVDDRQSLRIVSDELWEAAHKEMEQASKIFTRQKKGGLNKSSESRTFVFSGLMTCGCCRGKVTIVSGEYPNKVYGCHGARYKGICENRRTIGQRRLQIELLSYLATNLSAPEFKARIEKAFHKQLAAEVAEQARLAKTKEHSPEEYERKRGELKRQLDNILNSFQMVGPTSELKERHDALQAQLALLVPPSMKTTAAREFTCDEISTFLSRKLGDLASVLSSDLELAKHEVQQRITSLVLTPFEENGKRWYEISGDLRLFAREEDVMVKPFSPKLIQHYKDLSLPISLKLGFKPFHPPYEPAA